MAADDDQEDMQSERLKQAMIEIMAVARRYDVMATVTVSEKQCSRYSLHVPTWSVLQPTPRGISADNPSAASTSNFRLNVPRAKVSEDLDDTGARISGTLFAFAALADASAQYHESLEHVLQQTIKVLEQEGVSVSIERPVTTKKASRRGTLEINTVPNTDKN